SAPASRNRPRAARSRPPARTPARTGWCPRRAARTSAPTSTSRTSTSARATSASSACSRQVRRTRLGTTRARPTDRLSDSGESRPKLGWLMAAEVRFLRSRSGARIAYTVQGHGPPLICLPPWATHLAVQRSLPGCRAFHEALGRHHTVVLYDRWGTGLSDRERDDVSLDADVEVLRDLVDHLRLRRFAVFGPSDGGLVAALF